MNAQAASLTACLCSFAAAAFGQPGAQPTYQGTYVTRSLQIAENPIVGVPYSCEEVTETVRTLADGTRITGSATSFAYRDSLGRMRRDHSIAAAGPASGPKAPMIAEIQDIVARIGYVLDVDSKVAYRLKLPVPPGLSPVTAERLASVAANDSVEIRSRTATSGNGVETKNEVLGVQIVDGIRAVGRRTTQTYPHGLQGNAGPLVSTAESWKSPELWIELLSKRSDPRVGESTTKCTNLNRAEPGAKLFQFPPDYAVVDVPGPMVTVHYPAEKN